MTDQAQQEMTKETFEEFKNSFYYGSRGDLNFKFLKSLPDDQAARFFQELLCRLADSVDNGQVEPLTELFFTYQRDAYAGATTWAYEDGPFIELEKPISESRVALFTSSGHFVAGNDPQPFGVVDMTQEEAAARINEFLSLEPTLSTIPIDTPLDQLRVRHGGYDVRTVQADPNVALPLTRMKEIAADGRIGEFSPNAYSFAGACAQNLLTRRAAPQWAHMMHMDDVEAVVMVPV